MKARHHAMENKNHVSILVQGAVALGMNNTNDVGELYAIGAVANSIQRMISPKAPPDAHKHHLCYTTQSRLKVGTIHILMDNLYSANVITGQWKACNNLKVAAWTTRQVHALKKSGVKNLGNQN